MTARGWALLLVLSLGALVSQACVLLRGILADRRRREHEDQAINLTRPIGPEDRPDWGGAA